MLGLYYRLALLLISLFFFQSGHTQGLGPLTVTSQSPAQALRLTPGAFTPWYLEPGGQHLHFSSSISNIWVNPVDDTYFFDFEMADNRLSYEFATRSGEIFGLSFSERRFINAHLDQMIKNVHELLFIGKDGRDGVVNNQFHLYIPDEGIMWDERPFEIFSRTVGLHWYHPLQGIDKRWNPGLIFTTQVETWGDGAVPQGSTDYHLAMTAQRRIGQNYVYGRMGYTFFESKRFFSLPLREGQISLMGTFEKPLAQHRSLLLQYLYSDEVVVRGFNELSKGSHELHIGYKHRTGLVTWEMAILENIFTFDNSPDLGFSLGFSLQS